MGDAGEAAEAGRGEVERAERERLPPARPRLHRRQQRLCAERGERVARHLQLGQVGEEGGEDGGRAVAGEAGTVEPHAPQPAEAREEGRRLRQPERHAERAQADAPSAGRLEAQAGAGRGGAKHRRRVEGGQDLAEQVRGERQQQALPRPARDLPRPPARCGAGRRPLPEHAALHLGAAGGRLGGRLGGRERRHAVGDRLAAGRRLRHRLLRRSVAHGEGRDLVAILGVALVDRGHEEGDGRAASHVDGLEARNLPSVHEGAVGARVRELEPARRSQPERAVRARDLGIRDAVVGVDAAADDEIRLVRRDEEVGERGRVGEEAEASPRHWFAGDRWRVVPAVLLALSRFFFIFRYQPT